MQHFIIFEKDILTSLIGLTAVAAAFFLILAYLAEPGLKKFATWLSLGLLVPIVMVSKSVWQSEEISLQLLYGVILILSALAYRQFFFYTEVSETPEIKEEQSTDVEAFTGTPEKQIAPSKVDQSIYTVKPTVHLVPKRFRKAENADA